jgi:hypothetical protein
MRKLPDRRNLIPPVRRQFKSLPIQNQSVYAPPITKGRRINQRRSCRQATMRSIQ